MKTITWTRIALLLTALPFLAACFGLEIESGVRDPEAYFARAEREIASLAKKGPRESLRANTLCLLVYDGGDDQVIRFSVPLWIVKDGLDLGEEGSHGRHDSDIAKRYDMEWQAIKDLGSYGPGLLVSIEEEDNRVLIWTK